MENSFTRSFVRFQTKLHSLATRLKYPNSRVNKFKPWTAKRNCVGGGWERPEVLRLRRKMSTEDNRSSSTDRHDWCLTVDRGLVDKLQEQLEDLIVRSSLTLVHLLLRNIWIEELMLNHNLYANEVLELYLV